MATTDAMSHKHASPRSLQPTVKSHLAYTLLSGLVLMVMYSLLRVALLVYNREMIGDTPASVFIEAMGNGLRFDLRLTAYLLVPLLLALFSARVMAARGFFRFWLTVVASITLFLGLMEMDFYREFHQRLNGLVFQYVKEDPQTVLSMLWYGFPVVRYLLATRPRREPSVSSRAVAPWYARIGVFVVCLLIAVVAIRGTLRQGPPLRWGDAYTTESNFANTLGLNGTLTLISAAKANMSDHRDNAWKATLPQEQAQQIVRDMLLTRYDKLVDGDIAAVRRDFTPPVENTLPIKNVVVILMESFAGHSVGALGDEANITPYFDKLSREGLLFDHFFSNGTHTHQGMFATMACFPNLPAFEYLMRMPEGAHKLSGLPQLMSARNYDDVYVYNGNFAWDNQSGFFSNQGMTNFVGREDFVNPVFSDPTWGVSDQDMFDRGTQELKTRGESGKPFYALLQSLSNHTPYALPTNLPVERVTGQGTLDEHLTAMRYSDWALGQFFEKARKEPYFKETMFVVVGDHGFGNRQQITEMDLGRFNVPLLIIAPGVQEKFGQRSSIVGTQIDVVPTIMGRLGGETRHQCWGRDLLNLPEGDTGFGVIKPSGGEQTVALITQDRVLIEPKDMEPQVLTYTLGRTPHAELIPNAPDTKAMRDKLDSFLQTATKSLLDNTAGAQASKTDQSR
jgi:phosphoglycerol transferase MdoB-like AlkP superfamily enzyme